MRGSSKENTLDPSLVHTQGFKVKMKKKVKMIDELRGYYCRQTANW